LLAVRYSSITKSAALLEKNEDKQMSRLPVNSSHASRHKVNCHKRAHKKAIPVVIFFYLHAGQVATTNSAEHGRRNYGNRVYTRQVPGLFVPKTFCSQERIVPMGNFRSQDFSFPRTFVPRERKFPGTFVPGPFHSRELSFAGNETSWELSLPGPFVSRNFRSQDFSWGDCSSHVQTRNSSEDEIANVNFLRRPLEPLLHSAPGRYRIR